MANFVEKNWISKGNPNQTPVNAPAMNDLENRIKNAFESSSSSKLVTAGDFNSLINEGTGLYVMYSSTANSPKLQGDVGMHWYVLQIVYSASYCVQIAVGIHTDTKNIYMRNLNAGTWTAWSNGNAGDFNLAENGYQIFPSGLTMQWGTTTATLNSTEVVKNITFLKAFTNTCFQAQAILNDVGVNSTTLTTNIGCSSVSKTGAQFKIKNTASYANGKDVTIKWFAIGY